MRGELRRADRAISREGAEELLRQAKVGHLGTVGEDGYPYVVPVFFVWHQNKIYIHSASEGHKMRNIAFSPLVCFQAEDAAGISRGRGSPCDATAFYRSVVAFGRAKVVEGPGEKREVLARLTEKYGGDPGAITEDGIRRCAVIAIEIETVTGKANMSPAPGPPSP